MSSSSCSGQTALTPRGQLTRYEGDVTQLNGTKRLLYSRHQPPDHAEGRSGLDMFSQFAPYPKRYVAPTKTFRWIRFCSIFGNIPTYYYGNCFTTYHHNKLKKCIPQGHHQLLSWSQGYVSRSVMAHVIGDHCQQFVNDHS